MNRSRLQHRLTVALSAIVIVLGAVLMSITLVMGGGPLARGMFIGLIFVAIGSLRLWIARRGIA